VATPILRALTISSAIFAMGLSMQATVLILYFTTDLGLNPAAIGVVLAFGGAGTLLGSLVAGRVSNRLGAGPSIIGGTLIEAIAAFAIPASLLVGQPIVALCAAQLVNGIGFSIYSVNHLSLRQRIVNPRMLGRITAGRRFLTFSVAPVGAILGGWLGEQSGLVAPLAGAAFLLMVGALVMWASPVRMVRAVSTPGLATG
jgi:predicted MFS family arabinose efflux permease